MIMLTKIHQQVSLVFVVGQLEVINNNFYVYAKDINFNDTELPPKWQIFDNHNSSEAVNTIWSKLLFTHKNVIDDLKELSELKLLPSTSTNEFNKGSSFNLHSLKCASSLRYKKPDLVVLDNVNNEDFYNDEAINTNISNEINENNVIDTNELDHNLESDDSQKKKKSQKNSVRNSMKGGKQSGHSLYSTSRSNKANCNFNVKIE
ncbi:hypothetical protein F8M41_002302 [Gigaspora margarita]|uniref:Uncharacterized protein n=1 Tax=Gigaspora margarita TaxID=4874 RepID=A0A8H3XEF6_GIGMA|nr:hypothetical protein F8M41_002302 [Gigaspora margarita]